MKKLLIGSLPLFTLLITSTAGAMTQPSAASASASSASTQPSAANASGTAPGMRPSTASASASGMSTQSSAAIAEAIFEEYRNYLDGRTNCVRTTIESLINKEEEEEYRSAHRRRLDGKTALRMRLETYAHGNPEMEFRLGNIYYYNERQQQNGDNTYPTNYARAIRLYNQAAIDRPNYGHPAHAEAQYELGYCYQHGIGVSENLATAGYWYGQAASQGHVHAQEALAQPEVNNALTPKGKKRKTRDDDYGDDDDKTSVHAAKKSRSASQQSSSSLTSYEASSEDQGALNSNPQAAAHEDQARFPFLTLSNESYEASHEEIHSPIHQPSEDTKVPMAQSSEDTNVPMTPSSDDDYSLISVVSKEEYNQQPTTDLLLGDLTEEKTSATTTTTAPTTKSTHNDQPATVMIRPETNAAPIAQNTNATPSQEIPIFAEPEKQVV